MPAGSSNSGLYVLILRLKRRARIRIGALGTHTLEPGYYLYVGSARRNLQQRLSRHMAKKKTVRWHIDHLTVLPAVDRMSAVSVRQGASECSLNRRIGMLPDMTTSIPGFGASDCASGCPAHLWYSKTAAVNRSLAAVLGVV
jgi:sugar fermentation stimulation protein A